MNHVYLSVNKQFQAVLQKPADVGVYSLKLRYGSDYQEIGRLSVKQPKTVELLYPIGFTINEYKEMNEMIETVFNENK